MTNRVYLFDEMMYEDAPILGRYKFIEKYGKEKETLYDFIIGQNIRSIVKESLISIAKFKQEEKDMGKVNDWLIEMEEDAARLTEEEWVAKHGWNQLNTVWARVRIDINKNGRLKELDPTELQLNLDIKDE